MSNLSHTATLNISNYIAGINSMRQATDSFSESVVQQSEKIDSALRKFGTGLAAYFTIDAAKNFTSQLIRVRGEFQQLEIGLNTMLGSKAKADALMADVVEFATKTPFELNQVAAGTKQLIAYGAASDTVVDTLRRLGDIASGLNIPLGDLTYLYGTTMVQGRLYANDMLQFSNRGIPLIAELAKQFNVSVAEVKDLVSAGKVGFPEVEKAIKAMTDEGGRFAGLTEKNAESLTGLVSNLQDAIENAYNDVGKQTEGLLTDTIKFSITAVEHYKEIAKAIGLIVTAVGSYKAALIVTAVYQKAIVAAGNIKAWLSLAKGIRSSKDAMIAFNLACKANPFVLIISLLATATAAFLMFSDSEEDAAENMTGLQKATEVASEEFNKQAATVDRLQATLQSETSTLEQKKKALVDLQKIIPNYNAQLDEEGRLINANTDAIKTYLTQLERQIKMKAAQEELEQLYRQKRQQEKENKKLQSAADSASDQMRNFVPMGEQGEITMLHYSRQVISTSNALKKGQRELTKITTQIDELNKEIESTAVVTEKTAEAPKSFNQQLQDAESTVSRLRTELANLRSGKTPSTDYAKDIAEKAKELKDAEGKVNTLLGRTKYGKTGAGSQAARDYVDEYRKALSAANTKRSIEDVIRGFKQDITQADIEAEKDSNTKRLKQIRFTYEQQKEEIERQSRNLLIMLQEQEREIWEKENPKYKEKGLQFTPTITKLPDDYQALINQKNQAADQQFLDNQKELLQQVMAEYRDYNAQRSKLEQDYNSTVAFLNSQRNAENSIAIDSALAEAKRKYDQGLQDINDAEASSLQKNSSFLKNLFGDYATMGYDKLKELIEQAKQVRDYMSGKNDGKTLTFITKEQLDLIKKSPAELEKLKKATDNLLSQGKYGDSTWGKIFNGFEEGITKLGKAKGWKEVSGAIGSISDYAGQAAGEIANMFEQMGDQETADAISGVQQVMGAVSNIGQGFAKGGIVGGIAAAVGEAMNFIASAFAANARHKAALKAIMQETIAQQRAYNLLLLEQNLLYEKADTIFGVDSYSKAKNAVVNMRESLEALNAELRGTETQQKTQDRQAFLKRMFGVKDANAELKKAYAGLADIEIKTGHKKTGLFGWGKGKDIYSSVLSVYPDLIKANGDFNKELAQTILNTRTMSDEDKSALQTMIDLAEQAEEAYEALNDYLTDIFGNLGSEMMDSIVDAFKNGEDAAKSFVDSVSTMLETLAQQMIYAVTIGPVLEKAQKQMLDVMQNEGLTDEQKFNRWTSILNSLVDDAVGQQDIANKLLESYQQMAAQKGFDIFKPDEDEDEYTQNTSTSFQTLSQETGEELKGRFTAIQMNTAGILASILEIQALLTIQINHLAVIEKYTKVLVSIEEILQKVESNTADI